jgi:hypothetical protein
MKLRGLVLSLYIYESVTDLYIPTIGPQTQYCTAKSADRLCHFWDYLF